jgi:hypothetical protein
LSGHRKHTHPWGHKSLDALGPGERPYLDGPASPQSEEPAASEGLGVSIEALLQWIPANEYAILHSGGPSIKWYLMQDSDSASLGTARALDVNFLGL